MGDLLTCYFSLKHPSMKMPCIISGWQSNPNNVITWEQKFQLWATKDNCPCYVEFHKWVSQWAFLGRVPSSHLHNNIFEPCIISMQNDNWKHVCLLEYIWQKTLFCNVLRLSSLHTGNTIYSCRYTSACLMLYWLLKSFLRSTGIGVR